MEFFCTIKFNHFMWPHQFIKIFAYTERFFSRPATIDYTRIPRSPIIYSSAPITYHHQVVMLGPRECGMCNNILRTNRAKGKSVEEKTMDYRKLNTLVLLVKDTRPEEAIYHYMVEDKDRIVTERSVKFIVLKFIIFNHFSTLPAPQFARSPLTPSRVLYIVYGPDQCSRNSSSDL